MMVLSATILYILAPIALCLLLLILIFTVFLNSLAVGELTRFQVGHDVEIQADKCRGSTSSTLEYLDLKGTLMDSKLSYSHEKIAAFKTTRLTKTTFKIVEYDDIYSEHPFIYAKVLPTVILLLDTGCGGASKTPNVEVTKLREYIETCPVVDNGNEPLNMNGEKKYIVICSHCHYDHILALAQFAGDSAILASSHSPSFLSPENLPKHSLCDKYKIITPKYKPLLMDHLSYIKHDGIDTGVQVLHTPGHTPDELALWDESERMLYVGDTLYEWEPIIFPQEGDIAEWFKSVHFLIDWINQRRFLSPSTGSIKINSGHDTSMADASDVLSLAKAFMIDVISGKEPLKRLSVINGVVLVHYIQEGGRFSLICPERLVEDARKNSNLI